MSHYFSVLMPAQGQERAAAHAWAGGPYAEHQWLWKLFEAPPGTPRDFLYRRRDIDGLPRFYLLSRRPPEGSLPGWQARTAPYEPALRPGDRLRFELRANPTVARKSGDKSKRHDVVMNAKRQLLEQRGLQRWSDWNEPADRPALYQLVQEHCTAWLQRRAESHGFALDEATLSVEAYQQHELKRGSLRFTSVDFTGELTVTDVAAFNAVLCEGLGHAKAFGCGLLLVRRISADP